MVLIPEGRGFKSRPVHQLSVRTRKLTDQLDSHSYDYCSGQDSQKVQRVDTDACQGSRTAANEREFAPKPQENRHSTNDEEDHCDELRTDAIDQC